MNLIQATLLASLPAKRKSTPSGWISFNAPCCHHRGEKADKRKRGGVLTSGDGFQFHCFNCGFKCGFTLGKPISKNARTLLAYMGMDKEDIDKYSFESLQHKDLLDFIKVKREKKKIKFHYI